MDNTVNYSHFRSYTLHFRSHSLAQFFLLYLVVYIQSMRLYVVNPLVSCPTNRCWNVCEPVPVPTLSRVNPAFRALPSRSGIGAARQAAGTDPEGRLSRYLFNKCLGCPPSSSGSLCSPPLTCSSCLRPFLSYYQDQQGLSDFQSHPPPCYLCSRGYRLLCTS